MKYMKYFLARWRFVFSLPSMRRLLPSILRAPLRRLRQLFPSAAAIKQLISPDLAALLAPPSATATSATGPYTFVNPLPDLSLLPDIDLDE